jgi:transcription antitermination factor NusG
VESLNPSEDGEALFQNGHDGLVSGNENGLERLADGSAEGSWFALYTTCRHEKRVSQHLSQREIEHFLPLYVDHRKWSDGSKVALQLPLFPCYLFVRISRASRSKVLGVPGALAIVGGTGKEPAPLPDSAIDALRKGVEQRRVEPHPLVTAGQQVRIRSGPFSGMAGIVMRKKSGFRVVLTLQQIMQSVAVEVDEQDLELAQVSCAEPSLSLQFA